MSWNDIFQTALENNPDVSAASRSLKSAEYSLGGRRASFLPSFRASADAAMVEESFSKGTSASLTLFSASLKDVTSLSREKVAMKREEQRYRRRIADIVYTLKGAYASVLNTREEVKLATEVLERRRENSELVALRYEAGREDRGALLRSEADLARAELDFSTAERDFELSVINLFKEMGLEVEEDYGEIKGDFKIEELPPEPDIYLLAEKTPEYTIGRLNIKAAEYDYSLSRSNFFHDVSLSASRSYSAPDFDFNQGDWTTRVSLSVPFGYDLGNTYRSKRARLSVEQAGDDLRASRMDIIYNLKSAFSSLIDARQRISVREKYFNATQVRAEIAREKYLNGLISYQEWNMIEDDYMGVLNAVLDAQRRVYMAHAAWQRALGEY